MIDPQSNIRSRRWLGYIVALVVVVSMVMSTGPGVLLVNRPTMFLGLPLVYAWGILWYLVICLAALVAYRWVWSEEGDEPTGERKSL